MCPRTCVGNLPAFCLRVTNRFTNMLILMCDHFVTCCQWRWVFLNYTVERGMNTTGDPCEPPEPTHELMPIVSRSNFVSQCGLLQSQIGLIDRPSYKLPPVMAHHQSVHSDRISSCAGHGRAVFGAVCASLAVYQRCVRSGRAGVDRSFGKRRGSAGAGAVLARFQRGRGAARFDAANSCPVAKISATGLAWRATCKSFPAARK